MPSRVAVVMTAVSYQPIVEVGLRRDQQNQNGRQHDSHCRGNHTACSACEGKQLCLISNVTSCCLHHSFVCLHVIHSFNACIGSLHIPHVTDVFSAPVALILLPFSFFIFSFVFVNTFCFVLYKCMCVCLFLHVFSSLPCSVRDSIYPSFACTLCLVLAVDS